MGLSSDIMHDFANKEINAIYSRHDGWKVLQQASAGGYDTLLTLERRSGGHRDCIRALVTFEREVSPEVLGDLKTPGPCSDGTVTKTRFAVIIPANADTASLPSDVQVHTMRSFAYDGKELTWVKKPVRKTETPKISA